MIFDYILNRLAYMVTEARLEGKFRVLKQQLAILDSVLSKLDNLDNLVTYLNSFFLFKLWFENVYQTTYFCHNCTRLLQIYTSHTCFNAYTTATDVEGHLKETSNEKFCQMTF